MSDVIRTSKTNHGLVKRMRDLWTRIEPGTDDVVLMTQVSAILAEAAFRLERLEGEHENITRGRLPTHRCTVCDTFWMDLPEHKAMTMVGIMCGDVCCIGSNVEKLPAIRGSSETLNGDSFPQRRIPTSRDEALVFIERVQREIEIVCDHFGMDPAEFLADSRSEKAEVLHVHLWSGIGPDAYCIGCMTSRSKSEGDDRG